MSYTAHLKPDFSEVAEVDPTGRYGRYNEILGRGATKTVYRAFDEHEGIEVAWNQVKLYDFLQSPEDLERLYCEIHLLKTLQHKNIMKFHTSWVDTANRNINFVTEMFNSSLRQYRLKHRRVSLRTVRHWCRQILSGLVHLHTHDPPLIHRDLKCDNILINGNEGTVKIGDLGLSAILRKSHAAQFVGTPEFIAPEVYEEEYNELVDIYSFGMCVLEMVTTAYPYSECADNVEIYKKVISGKKPDALYKVKDPQIREFVEKCLAPVTLRLSARELLSDPFCQTDDSESDLRLLDHSREIIDRQRHLDLHDNSYSHVYGHSNGDSNGAQNEGGHYQVEIKSIGIENFDMSIKGKRRDDGAIILSLRAADEKGRLRKIYFPFDIEIDTTSNVATEMVSELDSSTVQDVTTMADMIDAEISSLVPEWRQKSAKYSRRQLQQLKNLNNMYNDAEPKPSQCNAMAQRKPQDSVTNNPIGCRPSVQSVPAGELISKQASYLGSKPTIYCGDPPKASTTILQPVSPREPVSEQASFDSENKPTTHLKVLSKATTTNRQAVAPQASVRTTFFRRWLKQKFFC